MADILGIRGLNTYQNDLRLEPGTLREALNINIESDLSAVPRRGFEVSLRRSGNIDAVFLQNDQIYTQSSGIIEGEKRLINFREKIQATLSLGKETVISGEKGIYVLNETSLYMASIPRCPDPIVITKDPTNGSAFKKATKAYRIIFVKKDDNRLTLGSPSNLKQVITEKFVDQKQFITEIKIPIPVSERSQFNYIYIYRTPTVILSDLQNPELFSFEDVSYFCGEIKIPEDPKVREINFTDNSIDDNLGEILYTSSVAEGLIAANDSPPEAKVLLEKYNRTFYGNVTQKSSVRIRLNPDGKPSLADLLTIGPEIYGPKGGDPSTFSYTNIESNYLKTLENLAFSINANSNFYRAYVIENLGLFFIESDTESIDASIKGNLFLDKKIMGKKDKFPGRLYFSKPFQPTAVPESYSFEVGRIDKSIIAWVGLRNCILVFKEDGLFKISGSGPDTFSVSLLDESVIIFGPNSLTSSAQSCFCLANVGIIEISEYDVGDPISLPIKDIVDSILAQKDGNDRVYMVRDESEYRIILSVPANQKYKESFSLAYHLESRSFTRWSKYLKYPSVLNEKIYYAFENMILSERKSRSINDYIDFTESRPVTVFRSASGGTRLLGDYGENFLLRIKDQTYPIYKDDEGYYLLEDLEAETYRESELYSPISIALQWNRIFPSSPHNLVQTREFYIHYQSPTQQKGNITFATQYDSGSSVAYIESSVSSGFGQGQWGVFKWGDPTEIGDSFYRIPVPLEAQRAQYFVVTFSREIWRESFKMDGISYIGRTSSGKSAWQRSTLTI